MDKWNLKQVGSKKALALVQSFEQMGNIYNQHKELHIKEVHSHRPFNCSLSRSYNCKMCVHGKWKWALNLNWAAKLFWVWLHYLSLPFPKSHHMNERTRIEWNS
jgi:hypothetical protein